MSLRRRLALAAAAAVAVTAIVAALLSYVAVRDALRSQVDGALQRQARRIDGGASFAGSGGVPLRLRLPLPGLPAREGGSAAYAQLVAPDGGRRPLGRGRIPLPVDAATLRIARAGRGEHLRDAHVDGTHLRMLTVGVRGSGAVELGRSLADADATLASLRVVLLLLCGGGIALAAALGALASRGLIAPIAKVTQAARRISETEDLGERIDVRGNDEVGELARHFNAMLERLEASRAALGDSMRAQRQLVSDASHELRTPITSLRTNIEVLLDGDALDPDARAGLLADVREQLDELGALVGDLIETARGDAGYAEPQDVRLDHLAEEAVARARRHAPAVHFAIDARPAVVEGVPERLGRALNNLLDNAARHSPPGGTVEVVAGPGGVRVRDHGSGIAAQDLEHLFDRFYRGQSARGSHGSGLGLAIVRQVAEAHGGTATAANADGGGARFALELPTRAVDGEPAAVAADRQGV